MPSPVSLPAPAPEGETIGDIVARCMENQWQAVLLVGLDPPWMSDLSCFEREKQARRVLAAAKEPLAVILEIPTTEDMTWHFEGALIFDRDFGLGAEFMCAGRDYFFSSLFFRLDDEALLGPVQLPHHITVSMPMTGLPPPKPPMDSGPQNPRAC
jgi:hypothetical protein